MLALCYNSTGNYDLSTETNKKGLTLANKYEIFKMKPYFIQSEGVNQFYRQNYVKAINLLLTTVDSISENQDFSNVMVANFYIGKSYWSLNEKEKAIFLLKKVDQAFIKHRYIRPDLRGNYELLINFYKDHDDLKSQLFYILRKTTNI